MMSIPQVDALLNRVLQRPIAYHRAFAEIGGGACAGLMLSQVWYWTPRAKMAGGWFYKTAKEWEAETGLTVNEQKTARRRLRERGLIEEALRGIPAKVHYRLNRPRLIELLTQHDESQTSSVENDKLDDAEASNLKEEKPCSITETKTEITTKTTSPPRVSPRGERGGRRDGYKNEVSLFDRRGEHISYESSPESRRMATMLRDIIGKFPNTPAERAAFDRLCSFVDGGSYSAEDCTDCVRWMLNSLDRVAVTPASVERYLPTFVTKKREKQLKEEFGDYLLVHDGDVEELRRQFYQERLGYDLVTSYEPARSGGYISKYEQTSERWSDPSNLDDLRYD
jgi:hypothetical protein